NCFVYLRAVQIDEALTQLNSNWFTADLPVFGPQPPCVPAKVCSDYNNQNNCMDAGCKWVEGATRAGAGYCTDK
ncbi:MAG: hypothetical protein ACK2T7_12720, partial [Anaerolineales bacterium]